MLTFTSNPCAPGLTSLEIPVHPQRSTLLSRFILSLNFDRIYIINPEDLVKRDIILKKLHQRE